MKTTDVRRTYQWQEFPPITHHHIVFGAIAAVIYATLAWMMNFLMEPTLWPLAALGTLAAAHGLMNPLFLRNMARWNAIQLWSIVGSTVAAAVFGVALLRATEYRTPSDALITLSAYTIGVGILTYTMAAGWSAGYELVYSRLSRPNSAAPEQPEENAPCP